MLSKEPSAGKGDAILLNGTGKSKLVRPNRPGNCEVAETRTSSGPPQSKTGLISCNSATATNRTKASDLEIDRSASFRFQQTAVGAGGQLLQGQHGDVGAQKP